MFVYRGPTFVCVSSIPKVSWCVNEVINVSLYQLVSMVIFDNQGVSFRKLWRNCQKSVLKKCTGTLSSTRISFLLAWYAVNLRERYGCRWKMVFMAHARPLQAMSFIAFVPFNSSQVEANILWMNAAAIVVSIEFLARLLDQRELLSTTFYSVNILGFEMLFTNYTQRA